MHCSFCFCLPAIGPAWKSFYEWLSSSRLGHMSRSWLNLIPAVCYRDFWRSKKCCGAYDLLKRFIRLEEFPGGLQLTSVHWKNIVCRSNKTAQLIPALLTLRQSSIVQACVLVTFVKRKNITPLSNGIPSAFQCLTDLEWSIRDSLRSAATQALFSVRVFCPCHWLHSCLLITYPRFMLAAGCYAR